MDLLFDLKNKLNRINTRCKRKFDVLKKNFTSGEEITEACLSCHTEAEDQLRHSIHWTWLSPTGDGLYGKAGYSLNNFCISTNQMQDEECSKCHIGWKGKEDGINCLKCHNLSDMDWTQEFKDLAEAIDSGDPDWSGKIEKDIQAKVSDIGLPQRKNCGRCHFDGGGGEGVKHGDLDGSLVKPKKRWMFTWVLMVRILPAPAAIPPKTIW